MSFTSLIALCLTVLACQQEGKKGIPGCTSDVLRIHKAVGQPARISLEMIDFHRSIIYRVKNHQ
jgi:hypothetical protein